MRKVTKREVHGSKAYQKAQNRANTYVKDPKKLNDLVEKAVKKAKCNKKGPLEAVWDDLSILMRLLKSYCKGEYRTIPISTLLILVTTVIYFVMPIDLIPDVLIGMGLLDDATLIGITLKSFQADLQKFKAWEENS